MTDEAKPCPFCGREPEVKVYTPNNSESGDVWARVACYKCAVKPDVGACRATFAYTDKNPYKAIRFRSDEEAAQLALHDALTAWNTRA